MEESADRAFSDRQDALEALIRTPRPGRRRAVTPWTLRSAAVGLWLRAALRLVVLVLAGFYVSHDIAVGERSIDFPDGALFVWTHYLACEVDNVLGVPAGWLTAAITGSAWTTTWLVAYTAVTVGYVLWGRLVWRGAVDAVRTGENAPVHPYPGMALVHAYEWLLLPWALALPVLTAAVLVLLRTASARAHLGLPVLPRAH
ncbi:MAG TPA: hypothetical protein VF755_20640 [Catenuloplanes sp.]